MTDPAQFFLNRVQHPLLAGIDLKLDRMQRLLAMMGNPQRRIPPVIHVAGTNGKGSTLAFLKAIFEAANYRVHRYTSPHLVRFSERIVLAGKEIDNSTIDALLRHTAPILSSQPATFFEATTAFAFLAFAEKKADILLLEVGMGGRLDATNVVDKPLLTVITPIAFDHMEYLGDTIEKIAFEKAGIIKPNTPCIVGRQPPEALAVIEKVAAEKDAPLVRLGHEFTIENNIGSYFYHSKNKHMEINPALSGEHQFDNAVVAIACIEQLAKFAIDAHQIQAGLKQVYWPARLQLLTRGALVEMLPVDMPVYLDGGHNQQGGEVLAAWIKNQQQPVVMMCAMVQGKDSKAYFEPMRGRVSHVYTVAIPEESTSQTAENLAETARSSGLSASAEKSPQAAMQAILANHAKSLVVICGSLYFAGYILRNHS